MNPFPKGVEQNAGEKKTCQQVKTAKYKDLYFEAYGELINCQDAGVHTSFKRLAIALAAYQKSDDVVPFDSPRDKALAADANGKFPFDDNDGGVRFTDEENRGHDLFYGKAFCSVCHNGQPNVIEARAIDPDGTSKFQVYTDYKYHHIGVPFNRQIPGVNKKDKKGLADHVAGAAAAGTVGNGFFKTPTLRNVGKGLGGKGRGKNFTHNGYFKTLEGLVHFYNTRDQLQDCATKIPNIADPTMDDALDNDCWPRPEFDNGLMAGAGTPPPGVPDFIGNLGLTDDDERDIVAYLKTLSDTTTASAP